MKKIIFFLVMLTLIACESPPVRRVELIADHPEWESKTVKIINEGFLLKGMTTDQVRASWGRPCWTCTGTTKANITGNWLAWEYQTQIVFFDKDEKVLRWIKK